MDDRSDAVCVNGLPFLPKVEGREREAAFVDEAFQEVRAVLHERPDLEEFIEIPMALEVVPRGRDDAEPERQSHVFAPG